VRRTISIALMLLYVFALTVLRGQVQPELPTPDQVRSQNPQEAGPHLPDEMRRNLAKKANQQRQAELKRDTEKLVKLSTELKEYVDKTNENILSVDVVKKADEIEKLAHSVKTKMRGDQYGNLDMP
jgi:uncharacterized membrane protein